MMTTEQIFLPRYPTRNAGFWFALISTGLLYASIALILVGALSNNAAHTMDGTLTLIGAVLVILALAVTTFIVYRIMRVERPKQVRLAADRLLVEDVSHQPPDLVLEIPLDRLTWVSVTDVPVENGPLPLSFKGLILRWQSPPDPTPQEYVISSRNIRNFDRLFDQVFDRAPQEIRGARTFRP